MSTIRDKRIERKISSAFSWQAEGEDGTLLHTADDTNGSPMRLDNRFRNRQAHAGALDAMPLIFPSIEFFEDMVDFLYFDPWPLVRNTDDMEFVVFLCRDPDGPIG
jgi:hypothetical protein